MVWGRADRPEVKRSADRSARSTTRFRSLLRLSEHDALAVLIDCVCSGGTGKPAAVYEGRAESCPSSSFYESRRASSTSPANFSSDPFADTVGRRVFIVPSPWAELSPRQTVHYSKSLPPWRLPMELILIVVVLLLLFGGGGYWGRRRGHW
jgi:hypothetical protein